MSNRPQVEHAAASGWLHSAAAVSTEEAWDRLRRHLDRSSGFWLGFIFTSDLNAAHTLSERARWNRQHHTSELASFRPEAPPQLATLLDDLELQSPAPPGCTWVEAIHVASADWNAAWTTFLQTLNHRRDTLRSRLGGLVLVAAPEVKPIAVRVATDLWSVRVFLAEVAPGSTVPLEPAGNTSLNPGSLLDLSWPRGSLHAEGPPDELDEDVQLEVLRLLAKTDGDLILGETKSRVAAAITRALSQGATSTASTLLLRRGEARLATGDDAGARDDLTEALKCGGSDATSRKVLNLLVRLTASLGELDEARGLAEREVTIAEDLAGRLGTPESQRDLSISLDNVAAIRRARGDLDGAETAYTRSLTIREDLAGRLGTPESQRDLSVSLDNVAAIRRARGDLDGA